MFPSSNSAKGEIWFKHGIILTKEKKITLQEPASTGEICSAWSTEFAQRISSYFLNQCPPLTLKTGQLWSYLYRFKTVLGVNYHESKKLSPSHFGLPSNRPQSHLLNAHPLNGKWSITMFPFKMTGSTSQHTLPRITTHPVKIACLTPSLTRICHVWPRNFSRTFGWCRPHRSRAGQGASIPSDRPRSWGRHLVSSVEKDVYAQNLKTCVCVYTCIYIIEVSSEVKLPTIWTNGKAEVGRVREETPRSEKIREEKEWEERRCRWAKR